MEIRDESVSKSLLFVYGTLKSGYVNYDRYLRVAVDGGKANLVSSGTSVGKYPLVLRPLTRLPATRGPMLLSTHNSSKDDWSTIDGEVYEIDADTLAAMDILEGVSSGFYYRTPITINLHAEESKQLECECYFYTVQESDKDLVDAGPLLSVYDDISHNEYVASPINNDILNLLQKSK